MRYLELGLRENNSVPVNLNRQRIFTIPQGESVSAASGLMQVLQPQH